MGGVPLDETTWKAILEESDINKDGKVSDFIDILLIFIYIYRSQAMSFWSF